MKEANDACNFISIVAFNKKIFNQFKLHREIYESIRSSFKISSQLAVRVISKVSDGYKLDRKVARAFKEYGAIAYDCRILSYKPNSKVSIWCLGGRQVIDYICYNTKYLPYIKGEADLVYKKGKFYLFQTVEVPEEDVMDIEEFIGVDFGQNDIAVLSDGTIYNSELLKKVRKSYSKTRSSIQRKGTRGSKRLLKRLSGREARFILISNHTISKQLVEKAKNKKVGIALEDLTNIRFTAKPKSKAQKTELNQWSFSQLRRFIEYKSRLSGVKCSAVKPHYTSQSCSICNHIGTKEKPFRKGKVFSCKNCNNISDADINAAKNIAAWGVSINTPEKSTMYCSLHY